MRNNVFIELTDTGDTIRHVNVAHIVELVDLGAGTYQLKVVLSNGKSFNTNTSIREIDALIIDAIAYYEHRILKAKELLKAQ